MSKKNKVDSIKRLIVAVEKPLKDTQSIANKSFKKDFESFVLADEAIWGLLYFQRSLTSILERLEEQDAPSKSHTQAKPKSGKTPSLGNRKILD
jgi:hypothetical protein